MPDESEIVQRLLAMPRPLRGAALDVITPSQLALVKADLERLDVKGARFRRFVDDPIGFVTATTGEHLWSAQKEILELVRENRRVAVKSAHTTGKTHVAARLACWWITTHEPGEAFVVTTAPSFPQVRAILWREIGRAFSLGKLPGRLNQTEWWLPVDGHEELVAMGRKPADYDPAAFSGIHSHYVLVILDEACGIPPSLWEAADTLVSNEDSKILAIGNPDDPGSHFAKLFVPDSGWATKTISAFDSPNFSGEKVPDDLGAQLVSPVWIEEKRKSWGEGSPLWSSKILGEFPKETEDGLIPYAHIAAARTREIEPGRPVQLSCDVARFGKDETVVMLTAGQVTEFVHLSHREDTMATAGQLVRLRREHDASLIRVDAIGVGGGVVDRLAEQGEPVLGLDAGASPSDPRFLNCRAEWYWLLRERFERGAISIPDDDDLAAQLSALRYEYTSRGKIKIESKDDMAKRGLPSPDRADALMMAFATDAIPPKAEYVLEWPARERYTISPF